MSMVNEGEPGYYLEDLSVGMSAEYTRTVTDSEIVGFAEVSGDNNPLHLDEEFAKTTLFGERIAHGMLSASFLSTIFGTIMPGPGCIYLSQNLRFKAPVKIGDTVTARVEVDDIDTHRARINFVCRCTVGATTVIEGNALIVAPRRSA